MNTILTKRTERRLLVALGLAVLMSFAWIGNAKDKPNVLFIFADDMSYETIRTYGYLDIDTPHLDRLANSGTSFSRAYNMGGWNGAICVASRTMLNTGRFIWQAKPYFDDKTKMEGLIEERKLWGQLMQDAGYETYFTGKWHVGPYGEVSQAIVDTSFNKHRDVRGGMPKQVPEGYDRPKDEADYDAGWKPWDTSKGGFWEGGKHWSEVVADHSIDYLENAAKSEKPFFMYLAFNAPHDPRQAPKEYIDRYPLERVAVPENFIPEYPYTEEICGKKLRDERLAPYPRTEYSVQVNRQEYFALVTHMDDQIGRILEALEATGKADNTYIVFTADHGLSVGHHGLIGKQNMYEHSIRVPFIVKGPGVKAGKDVDVPIYLQDVMASSLDWAGIKKPEYVDFNSVAPLLKGKKKGSYDSIYGAYINRQRMVKEDGWKFISYPTAKVERLYNLNKDPHEMEDLALNPEYAGKMNQMRKKLKALQAELGDELEL